MRRGPESSHSSVQASEAALKISHKNNRCDANGLQLMLIQSAVALLALRGDALQLIWRLLVLQSPSTARQRRRRLMKGSHALISSQRDVRQPSV